MSRTFSHSIAKRSSVPLLVGLTGASGAGKTYSALRLATGIQRVTSGEIFVVDTESRRALHYADSFRFQHIEFGAPFSPLDYLSAIDHCVKSGAKVVVVDSMSHEHEGPGGVLEMHDEIVAKRSDGDWKKAQAITFSCWSEPKAQRRRLINSILQLGINAVFCFRAKEKVRLPSAGEKQSGQREPIQLGWMPIAGEEFVYEMTANCLLMPGSKGTPTWSPEHPGERLMAKLPAQFSDVLRDGAQLTEDTGERMARWAAGDAAPPTMTEALLERIACADLGELSQVRTELEAIKAAKSVPAADFQKLRAAWSARQKMIAGSYVIERDPGQEG